MGTYALGAFLMEERDEVSFGRAQELIRELRNKGKLGALPVVGTEKTTGALIASDGTQLREYGKPGSGRWVRLGEQAEGSVLYLGSASHAGHIELKALCVMVEDRWHNIITGLPEDCS